MSDDEKSVYKNKSDNDEPIGFANNAVVSGKTSKSGKEKKTSQGQLVSDIEREQKEEQKKLEKIKRRIEKIFECYPVLEGEQITTIHFVQISRINFAYIFHQNFHLIRCSLCTAIIFTKTIMASTRQLKLVWLNSHSKKVLLHVIIHM